MPILFAWGSKGFGAALATLIFITIYQQIENMVISPKISEKTMDLNPAVAFLSVLILGAVFGALGAFLALPVTASLQAIFKVCTKQYHLVSSPLMDDPKPEHKSIMVKCFESIRRNFMKPVSDSVQRVMKGTSSRVSMNEDILYWYKQAYVADSEDVNDDNATSSDSDQLDALETMPISREILDQVNKDVALNSRKRVNHKKLAGSQQRASGQQRASSEKNTKNVKNNVKNNPRSGWKQ